MFLFYQSLVPLEHRRLARSDADYSLHNIDSIRANCCRRSTNRHLCTLVEPCAMEHELQQDTELHLRTAPYHTRNISDAAARGRLLMSCFLTYPTCAHIPQS